MVIKYSNLITSAFQKSQWPNTTMNEVVMVGRSNVGKSSLINAVCNRKNLAYVGKTPGKTRLLNFFSLNDEYVLVDAPGYGYAAKGAQTFRDFGRMMDEYFMTREQCKGMILLLDIRRTPNDDDCSMIEYAVHNNIPFRVVVTKADKVSNNEKNKQLSIISKTILVPANQLIVVSAEKKTGVEAVRDAMEELLKG